MSEPEFWPDLAAACRCDRALPARGIDGVTCMKCGRSCEHAGVIGRDAYPRAGEVLEDASHLERSLELVL